MTPTRAQRQRDVWRDCVVSPAVFPHMVDRLGDFVVSYQHVRETEASPYTVSLSLQELLSPLPRKKPRTSRRWSILSAWSCKGSSALLPRIIAC